MLKWLLLTEHQAPVQPDALRPHSATFLLSNSPAHFRSPLCSKHVQPHVLLQKQPRCSGTRSRRKRFPDPAWTSQQGGEHQAQPWTGTPHLWKIQRLFEAKILTIRMEEDFFFPLPPSFFSLPSCFSLLISQKSASIFQFPF